MWTVVKTVCGFVRVGAGIKSEQDANEAWRGQGETKFPLQVSERKRTVGFFGSADKPYTCIFKENG